MAQPTKAELRKEFLAQRDALDAAQRARNSSLIRQRLFQHAAWKNASVILCYVSFGSEVETHFLIQEALRFKKRIVVPLHDPNKKDETLLCDLQRFGQLSASHRSVLQVQPEFRRLADPTQVELALIPGIVFDRQGGRIGFGGGYFDRLLPQMPKAFRLALAHETQLSAAPLPLEKFDANMQAIATEKEILEIRAR